MLSTAEIRQIFLDYFFKQSHEVVTSSSLIPKDDPSLLFTNSGMVQFKEVFLGNKELPYKRATSAQKCLRAGGKHNDLENVGYTKRHHTFFEMLGSFSFGDYFKEQAILYAWEFLTKILAIDPNKLIITVYFDDDEAFNLWKKISGFSENKILRIKGSDNFWQMGDTGPCGPCSEIFYDNGSNLSGGLPGSPTEGDRFVEIWNLVFMQYQRSKQTAQLTEIPVPSVDTGMGLERIAAVLQAKTDNYEIDIFKTLIDQIVQLTGRKKITAAHKIVADHLRAAAFLIADGVIPANEGRSYVLRRIIRRAIRHAHSLSDPMLMHKLVPTLVDVMGDFYKELIDYQKEIISIIKIEENSFEKTLSSGLDLLHSSVKGLKKGAIFPGEIAFNLYDTFGFPLDLTKDFLKESNVDLDENKFNVMMKQQKETSKKARKEQGHNIHSAVWQKLSAHKTNFLGYDESCAEATVIAIVSDEKQVNELNLAQSGYVITDNTTFYARSGGQEGDIGRIVAKDCVFEVQDTYKVANTIVHFGKMKKGTIRVTDKVYTHVNRKSRLKIKANHTTMHLLHAALRQELGENVFQRGSFLNANYGRLDFSYGTKVSQQQLNKIINNVNKVIRDNVQVTTKIMNKEDAIKFGAMALFGEKYQQEVRVVIIKNKDDFSSIELCGGTHIGTTGSIGLFAITDQSAVASGVRRIEYVTGQRALDFLYNKEEILNKLTNTLKSNEENILAKVDSLVKNNERLLRKLNNERINSIVNNNLPQQNIGEFKFVYLEIKDFNKKNLRELGDKLRTKLENLCAIINCVDDSLLAIVTSKDSTVSSRKIVRELAQKFSLKGGGSETLAFLAKSSNVSIKDLKAFVQELLRKK